MISYEVRESTASPKTEYKIEFLGPLGLNQNMVSQLKVMVFVVLVQQTPVMK